MGSIPPESESGVYGAAGSVHWKRGCDCAGTEAVGGVEEANAGWGVDGRWTAVSTIEWQRRLVVRLDDGASQHDMYRFCMPTACIVRCLEQSLASNFIKYFSVLCLSACALANLHDMTKLFSIHSNKR